MSTLFYIASKLCLLNAECMTHMNVDVEVRQVSCASVLLIHKHITGENISVCCDAVVLTSVQCVRLTVSWSVLIRAALWVISLPMVSTLV